LTELGNRLKEARLEKGMSIDDLQVATKIQKRYLTGIEEGNYSMIPGPFYVRAFIKQYCEAVGLHAEEIFEQYKSDIPVIDDIPEKLSRVQTRKSIPSGGSKLFEILPKVLIAVFIIGAAAVVYYFLSQNNNDNMADEPEDAQGNTTVVEEAKDFTETEKNKDDQKAPAEETEEESKPVEEAEEEPAVPAQEITVAQSSGKNTVYELKNADQFQLKLVSTGATWVSISNGKGSNFFQGTLKKGETESQTIDFSKETEAVLIIGKSTETEIYINDQKVEYAVAPKDVVTQNITIRYLPNNE